MDDLTSKSTVHDGMMKYGFIAPDMTVHEFVEDELPSIPAVPLDKLCKWLERYATMDCDGCREAFGSCEDTEPSVCNSLERWKAMLTKWMEGLDDTNRHEDA